MSTSELKPIVLYGKGGGPNPWKVAIVLEELSLPYTMVAIPYDTLHTPSFEKYNPNGRVPAIEDPNTGLVMWESGAIIEYLIDNYDKEHVLSYDTLQEKYHCLQYLHFQMSGQGPYFGQGVWFLRSHQPKVPSAITRYQNECRRLIAVRNTILADGNKTWLVGDKCTYADLCFVMWDSIIPFILRDDKMEDLEKEYPHFWAWNKRLMQRPSVKKIVAEREASIAEPA